MNLDEMANQDYPQNICMYSIKVYLTNTSTMEPQDKQDAERILAACGHNRLTLMCVC